MNMKKALSFIVASMLILMLVSCTARETKESGAKADTTKETTSETTRGSESETTSGTTSEVTISDTTPSTEMPTESESETESETTASDTTVPKADPTEDTSATDDAAPDTTSSDESTQDTDSTEDSAQDSSSVTSVTMPDVMGMNYNEATDLIKKELQAAGFSEVIVSVGWAWGDGNPDKALTVMSQEPAAGTSIDVNDPSITVIIMVQEHGIE